MWQQNTNRMNLVLSEEIHLKLQSKTSKYQYYSSKRTKIIMPASREDSVYLAKLAEQAERYEEMVENMKAVASSGQNCLLKNVIYYLLLTRMSLVLVVLLGELFHQLNKRRSQRK